MKNNRVTRVHEIKSLRIATYKAYRLQEFKITVLFRHYGVYLEAI